MVFGERLIDTATRVALVIDLLQHPRSRRVLV